MVTARTVSGYKQTLKSPWRWSETVVIVTTVRGRRSTIPILVAAVVALLVPAASARAAGDPIIDAQQLVYEMNLARWNPSGYAVASGVPMPLGIPARQPVALSPALSASATFKANELADHDYFAHQSAVTGKWPNELAREYGFALPSWWTDDANYIESLHGGSDNPYNVLGSFAGSPSHRAHIFGEGSLGSGGFPDYDQIGVGRSTNENYWAVHTAYSDSSAIFATGVVYDDLDSDGRMDRGEGIGGVTVTAGSVSTVTNAGGGYAIQVTAGTIAVSASGIGSRTVTVGIYNVGIDFPVGADPVVRAYELCQGLQPTMLGTDGDDVFTATPARDVIHGLGGFDVASGLGADDVVCSIEGDGATATGESLRLAGIDRFATAVEVSQAVYPDGAGVVYLAAGYNFPDALAAGPAAAAEGGPILLASQDNIPTATRNELVRLDPHTVVVVGGEAALSAAVQDQAAALLPTATIDRRAGATRYETAVAISQGAFPDGAETVYIVTGEDFPNALAAAPAAVNADGPLLLVRSGHIPSAVLAELARLAPTKIEVVAGPAAVSDGVVSDLSGFAPTSRVFGLDRYATAAATSQLAFPDGVETVYVATGWNYPDALAGGAATAAAHGPILLVQPNSIPGTIAGELTRLAPTRIVILGGPAAVSSAVASQLAGFLP